VGQAVDAPLLLVPLSVPFIQLDEHLISQHNDKQSMTSRPKPLSSQPKRKWGGGSDDDEEENKFEQLGSEEWPLTPPKPKSTAFKPPAQVKQPSASTVNKGGVTGRSSSHANNIKSTSTTTSSSSNGRALAAKPSFTAHKLAPIFGSKPTPSTSNPSSSSRSTSLPASSYSSFSRATSTAPSTQPSSAAYAFNQESALPKKRHLPWADLEASTSKQTRTGSSNFHELSGPSGSSKLAGVKGQMLTSSSMDIKQKVLLSPEQQMVHKLVVEDGKSVFFTGSAGSLLLSSQSHMLFIRLMRRCSRVGTGKSVLLREIIASLKRKHKGNADAVAVTASTGMAACNIGGTTIHSFAGIGIGAEPAPKLIDKIKKNRNANARWQRCKVLVVDEGEHSDSPCSCCDSADFASVLPLLVSMVDGILFDKLAEIGTALKKRASKSSSASSRPFGGIQVRREYLCFSVSSEN